MEVYNDDGATQAMAYPTPTARRKQTFMLFAFPTGVQGNVVSPGVNELMIPNYKHSWADIRKIASAPGAARRHRSSRGNTRSDDGGHLTISDRATLRPTLDQEFADEGVLRLLVTRFGVDSSEQRTWPGSISRRDARQRAARRSVRANNFTYVRAYRSPTVAIFAAFIAWRRR